MNTQILFERQYRRKSFNPKDYQRNNITDIAAKSTLNPKAKEFYPPYVEQANTQKNVWKIPSEAKVPHRPTWYEKHKERNMELIQKGKLQGSAASTSKKVKDTVYHIKIVPNNVLKHVQENPGSPKKSAKNKIKNFFKCNDENIKEKRNLTERISANTVTDKMINNKVKNNELDAIEEIDINAGTFQKKSKIIKEKEYKLKSNKLKHVDVKNESILAAHTPDAENCKGSDCYKQKKKVKYGKYFPIPSKRWSIKFEGKSAPVKEAAEMGINCKTGEQRKKSKGFKKYMNFFCFRK